MYEVNRSVFLLIPLDPFWNWLQTLPGNHLDGLTLEDIQADANSYLVRPCETADEVWDEIEARFEDIFAAELADWCEDESEWPDLNADIFNEWFDIQLSTVITKTTSAAVQTVSACLSTNVMGRSENCADARIFDIRRRVACVATGIRNCACG